MHAQPSTESACTMHARSRTSFQALANGTSAQYPTANAGTRAEIERVAALQSSALSWLSAVLLSHALDPASGLLVRLHEFPNRKGT